VGTDKRERQKQNRQQRLEEMARDARKQKSRRRALQLVIGIPALIAGVYLLVLLLGSDDDNATVVGASSTTVASDLGSSTTAAEAVSTTIGTPPSTIAGGAYPCPATDGSPERVVSFPAAPPTCIDPAKTYSAEVVTNVGTFLVALDATNAPITVNNFVYLSRYHFYDGTSCHRVVPDYIAQCGDPEGNGSGGPGYTINDELPEAGQYTKGAVAMANGGPNTNGSQFFVVTGDASALPPNYTLFGHVTDGLDTTIAGINALGVADGVPPSSPINIESVTITEA